MGTRQPIGIVNALRECDDGEVTVRLHLPRNASSWRNYKDRVPKARLDTFTGPGTAGFSLISGLPAGETTEGSYWGLSERPFNIHCKKIQSATFAGAHAVSSSNTPKAL